MAENRYRERPIRRPCVVLTRAARVRHSATINHGLPHCSTVNHRGRWVRGRVRPGTRAQREMKPIHLCQISWCLSLANHPPRTPRTMCVCASALENTPLKEIYSGPRQLTTNTKISSEFIHENGKWKSPSVTRVHTCLISRTFCGKNFL